MAASRGRTRTPRRSAKPRHAPTAATGIPGPRVSRRGRATARRGTSCFTRAARGAAHLGTRPCPRNFDGTRAGRTGRRPWSTDHRRCRPAHGPPPRPPRGAARPRPRRKRRHERLRAGPRAGAPPRARGGPARAPSPGPERPSCRRASAARPEQADGARPLHARRRSRGEPAPTRARRSARTALPSRREPEPVREAQPPPATDGERVGWATAFSTLGEWGRPRGIAARTLTRSARLRWDRAAPPSERGSSRRRRPRRPRNRRRGQSTPGPPGCATRRSS